jgi:hypothetical protein
LDGDLAAAVDQSPRLGLQLEGAKRELARLITSSQQASQTFLRSSSLPSFPECFPVLSLPEVGGGSVCAQMFSSCLEPTAVQQEELDALDEEIKRIVGDVAEGARSQECLRPRPIRTNPLSSGPAPPGAFCRTDSGAVDEEEEEEEEEDEGDEDEEGGDVSKRIMLAVVSTVSQTYQMPRSLVMTQEAAGSAPPSFIVGDTGRNKVLATSMDTQSSLVSGASSGSVNTVQLPKKCETLVSPPAVERRLSERTAEGGGFSDGGDCAERLGLGPFRSTASPHFVFKKTSQFSGKYPSLHNSFKFPSLLPLICLRH